MRDLVIQFNRKFSDQSLLREICNNFGSEQRYGIFALFPKFGPRVRPTDHLKSPGVSWMLLRVCLHDSMFDDLLAPELQSWAKALLE